MELRVREIAQDTNRARQMFSEPATDLSKRERDLAAASCSPSPSAPSCLYLVKRTKVLHPPRLLSERPLVRPSLPRTALLPFLAISSFDFSAWHSAAPGSVRANELLGNS